MISIFHKRVSKGGRRRRGADGKVHGIINAGIRLLARKDYEAISMEQFAREAGCSVGSLYSRFSDKESYLYHLIASAYRAMAHLAATELDAQPTRQMPLPSLVGKVVEIVVSTMTDARAAGAIRATIKLSTVKPTTIKLYEDYREEVTQSAVAVLLPRISSVSAGAIRLGMQIVLATITDAVVQPRPGPMVAGSKRMKDALTQMMLGYLGVSESSSRTGNEAEGEDESPSETGDADQDDKANDANAVYDPDLRTVRRSNGAAKQQPIAKARKPQIGKPGPVSRNTESADPPVPPAVNPPTVPKGPPGPIQPKRRRRVV